MAPFYKTEVSSVTGITKDQNLYDDLHRTFDTKKLRFPVGGL